MKLPIKKKYFDQIKARKKMVEIRDAHITFVCEKTGEELRKEVTQAEVVHFGHGFLKTSLSKKEYDELFKDNYQIFFYLK